MSCIDLSQVRLNVQYRAHWLSHTSMTFTSDSCAFFLNKTAKWVMWSHKHSVWVEFQWDTEHPSSTQLPPLSSLLMKCQDCFWTHTVILQRPIDTGINVCVDRCHSPSPSPRPVILSLAISLPPATCTKWRPWTLFTASTEAASYAS